ncbi:unnamed protein product [Heligmosomoides polygyrus]|uniref:Secreted protein n=1 Tax=Heligmosomoides polygyrus TaxID=6339 RepID=A0A183FT62_HELPZ|nr:unnamed protein product [Heligmosomoides polygyrus]
MARPSHVLIWKPVMGTSAAVVNSPTSQNLPSDAVRGQRKKCTSLVRIFTADRSRCEAGRSRRINGIAIRVGGHMSLTARRHIVAVGKSRRYGPKENGGLGQV